VPLLIRDVQLITMTEELVLSGRSVLIGNGVIEAIGGSELHPPAGAVVIEGRGRYLLPGLIDMHVHLNSADLPLYPHNGITTVRNMWGWPGLIPLIARVESGELTGPRIISASQGLDDEPVQWRYLKVYTRLRRDTYAAIMAEAAATGMIPIGHVPLAVPVQEAIAMGQRTIEHLTGYDRAVSRSGNAGTGGWIDADPSRYPALAVLTAGAGVWNCPTLAIYSELSKQSPPSQRAAILEQRRLFVRELLRAGAPLLAGSDAGIEVVAPGTSLHDELDELVAAGLSRYQALQAATGEAGRFLGIEGLGTLAVGAPADLLLVAGNPLTDLGRLRRFDGLVRRGGWIPASR
jgi:imidazolonepropionase-like amidohydrolase